MPERATEPQEPLRMTAAEYRRQQYLAMSEHEHQCALMDWAGRLYQQDLDGIHMLHAIPNGGHRKKRVAARLRNEGVKAGVPDLCLPVPRAGYHGCYIELKKADRTNGPTEMQQIWITHLRIRRYAAAVCYGWHEARDFIMAYLDGKAFAVEAMMQDASTQDAPVQDAPVQDAPVQDAPVQDAPVQDAPVQDADDGVPSDADQGAEVEG